ncbi:uncharacterized protein LOC133194648 [Saccostrea echinata]|uniref:uncharacterized protein LOC133194648 n=1 Tax=Saccostrea echinata TaxID=191078 RepID=UPI002A82AEF4|nr:uncharacterized protein LOC133194648 [Saccostrea echinata]
METPRQTPEVMDETNTICDESEVESDNSEQDDDGQVAQHWDETDDDIIRDITNRDERHGQEKRKWFKKTDVNLGYLHPVTVWQKRVQNDGPASYIPIQRILGKCAWTIKKHGHQHFMVVSPLPRRVFS